jgi:hypothetical protein
VGGISETGGTTSSAEVIDLETSATSCDNFTSFPNPFYGGVGGLGLRNEPLTCQSMISIYKIILLKQNGILNPNKSCSL